jgi:hypothetical protein
MFVKQTTTTTSLKNFCKLLLARHVMIDCEEAHAEWHAPQITTMSI